MGCLCNKHEGEEMIVLNDYQINRDAEDLDPKLTFSSRKERMARKNKRSIEMIDDDFSKKTSFAIDPSKNKNDSHLFSEQMVKEINLARTNPAKYAEKINNYKKNIYTDNHDTHYFCVDLNAKINMPCGKTAFDECIEYLKNLAPRNELSLIDELKISFPTKTPEQATSREYITAALIEKAKLVKDKYTINWFHYDNNINDPVISTVLQIVDDNNSNGERRKHLLDENIKYVGINLGLVQKNIYCIYLVFAA